MNRFLDLLRLSDPLNATPVQRAARQVYRILAMLFTAGLVLMVFVAGVGALVDSSHFGAHRGFSYPLMLLMVIMLVVGFIGRIGFVPLFLTGITLVILTFQFPFIYAFSGSGRALHVANALLLFWLSTVLQQHAQRLVTETQAGEPTAASRALPAVGTFVLSGLFTGLYTIAFPAAGAAAGLSAESTGAEIYAASCASCHGDDGSGAFGPALLANPNVADTEHVREVITEGRGAMPPQAALSAEQIAEVIAFVQTDLQEAAVTRQ